MSIKIGAVNSSTYGFLDFENGMRKGFRAAKNKLYKSTFKTKNENSNVRNF